MGGEEQLDLDEDCHRKLHPPEIECQRLHLVPVSRTCFSTCVTIAIVVVAILLKGGFKSSYNLIAHTRY